MCTDIVYTLHIICIKTLNNTNIQYTNTIYTHIKYIPIVLYNRKHMRHTYIIHTYTQFMHINILYIKTTFTQYNNMSNIAYYIKLNLHPKHSLTMLYINMM